MVHGYEKRNYAMIFIPGISDFSHALIDAIASSCHMRPSASNKAHDGDSPFPPRIRRTNVEAGCSISMNVR